MTAISPQPLYPWQQVIYSSITQPFSQGRGHHALLFKTEAGLGSEVLIRHFAHWLLCQNKNSNEPCHQCKSCLLAQSGNHPDFHQLEPIENRDIGVDQVRDVLATLQRFAQQEGNVVVYIRQAERLTEASCNALLKTLEEPHEGVYFLLETDLQAPMMATIQSRCQTWVLHAPETLIALQWLQMHCPQFSETDIETALRLCHGRPLICKTFLENDRLSARKTFLQTFWRFYKNRDPFLLLSQFEKEQVQMQLEWLQSFFSDALKAKMGMTTGWVNHDLDKGIWLFSDALSAQQPLKGYDILCETEKNINEINAVNIELMLANGLTRLVLEVF